MRPIYLDYAATTPLDPRVLSKMQTALQEEDMFGNAASPHFYGRKAANTIEVAREQIAQFIGASPSEILFTSGATEANNLALKGGAYLYQRRGKHIITMQTEHKAVLDVCQYLEKQGYEVTYLPCKANGCLDIERLQQAIRDDTVLVSIMHVNNETGMIQDIAAIAEITAKRRILFHVDAAQSAGKVPLKVSQIPIDMVSLCAHKAYGPKGVGALYLRKKPRVRVEALLHGGGHEQGMRSGTLATHQIIGMGETFAILHEESEKDYWHAKKMRDHFFTVLCNVGKVHLNTDLNQAVPHILNIRLDGYLADVILSAAPEIAASTASACQGGASEGSHVLRAMGLTLDQVKSSIRFSFGRFTSDADVIKAGEALTRATMQVSDN